MTPRRIQLIGLDKPESVPLSAAADRPAALRNQASVHEQHRLESVAETLVLIGIMGVRRLLHGREIITVIGANDGGFQWGKGAAAHGTVAAHCLPGQLQINSSPFHRMPNWTEAFLKERGLKPLQLDSKLKNVSARTDVVDEVVNKTDSLMEKMGGSRGLKPRFAGAVHQVLERALFQRPHTTAALSELVLSAMSYYRLGASYACEERLDGLERQVKSATADVSPEQREQQILVAKQYLAVLQNRSFLTDSATMSGVAAIAQEVVADSPR